MQTLYDFLTLTGLGFSFLVVAFGIVVSLVLTGIFAVIIPLFFVSNSEWKRMFKPSKFDTLCNVLICWGISAILFATFVFGVKLLCHISDHIKPFLTLGSGT